MKTRPVLSFGSLYLSFLVGVLPVHAQERQETWFTVSDTHLDAMRGGFDVGGGLMVSLGISMVTYINGQLVTETAIAPTQLHQLNTEQASNLQEQLGTLNVVQNGPGNRWGNYQSPSNGDAVVHQLAGKGPGTVIQNSLNNQHIQNYTVLDVSSNASSLMQSNHWQHTLRDSLSSSGGLR